ncbi:PTS system mannose/fructose/sorbose family transporter subunit IID [Sporolactobacillus shoreicorticis]|uniref:PTS system mannose/fructose/sorbose family transporter subunit IID n=1 Tax=Sporolactobacillus shoreicorticis TaxID=1923877 RepID=A0ABW5S0N3_9BACL|nr:PTS system mannose/fructose/sorbose family transporter subunit IID [Sporolactobacillus shoreicorticis]MCO7124681.1 PTS system mannose/fructose/sorbose family transporter subunit IID [Sporolactobacillus shoreicorticis]
MSETTALTREEKKDISKIFWRGMFVMNDMTYVRMQGPGFGWTLMPLLKKLHKNDENAYYEALKRNVMYFNTNPAFLPFIQGIVYSMEKENAKKPIENIGESVNGLKVGLMGPLAGLGDSFFTGTLRVIAAGVGMGMAMKGNILGPLLFLLIFHIPFYFVRYYGGYVGYKFGSGYIQKATESGLLKSITKGCSILGMMMIGAMTFLNVPFKLTIGGKLAGAKFDLQTVIDQILKGLLPLSLVMLLLYLLHKGKSANWLLIGLLIFAVIIGGIGFAG